MTLSISRIFWEKTQKNFQGYVLLLLIYRINADEFRYRGSSNNRVVVVGNNHQERKCGSCCYYCIGCVTHEGIHIYIYMYPTDWNERKLPETAPETRLPLIENDVTEKEEKTLLQNREKPYHNSGLWEWILDSLHCALSLSLYPCRDLLSWRDHTQ